MVSRQTGAYLGVIVIVPTTSWEGYDQVSLVDPIFVSVVTFDRGGNRNGTVL